MHRAIVGRQLLHPRLHQLSHGQQANRLGNQHRSHQCNHLGSLHDNHQRSLRHSLLDLLRFNPRANLLEGLPRNLPVGLLQVIQVVYQPINRHRYQRCHLLLSPARFHRCSLLDNRLVNRVHNPVVNQRPVLRNIRRPIQVVNR